MNLRQYETPFRHWVIDDFAPAKAVLESYLAVKDDVVAKWVWYENDAEQKRATNDFRSLSQYARGLAAWVTTQAEPLEQLTGVSPLEADPDWHGGGYHVTERGGYLAPHIDYAVRRHRPDVERRVNVILYLTPGWVGDYGGEVELWNDDATQVVHRIAPAFNRAVVWCPGDETFHSVREVSGPLPRVSLATYFFGPARPGAVRKRALFVPQRG